MAAITIRNLDDNVKANLRIQAASNGRSMEEEARRILRDGVMPQPAANIGMGTYIRQLFEPLGGVELDLPSRDEPMRGPDFDQ